MLSQANLTSRFIQSKIFSSFILDKSFIQYKNENAQLKIHQHLTLELSIQKALDLTGTKNLEVVVTKSTTISYSVDENKQYIQQLHNHLAVQQDTLDYIKFTFIPQSEQQMTFNVIPLLKVYTLDHVSKLSYDISEEL